jgi:hypothetical protein
LWYNFCVPLKLKWLYCLLYCGDKLAAEGGTMPRGDKSKYTEKQQRQAEHIEEGYEGRGLPEDEAERRAWATVNAMTGGGKEPGGSGRGKKINKAPARKGGRIGGPRGGAASAARPAAARSASAKKAAKTRAAKKKGTKKSTASRAGS